MAAVKAKGLLTFEQVHSVIRYDPETGHFWYKSLPKNPTARKKFLAGKPVEHHIHSGYTKVSIFNCRVYSHRLAWLLFYGDWPSLHIDHIDGNRTNNRIENLRLATVPQNIANQKRSKRNTSGQKGVSWCKYKRRWCARLIKNGKVVFSRYLADFDEAAAVYRDLARSVNGEFARFD